MRSGIATVLLLAGLVVAAGCDSSSGTTQPPEDEVLRTLADCTGLRMEQVVGLSEGVLDVIMLVFAPNGGPGPLVEYDPETGEFSVQVDLDGDESMDATVSGTLGSDDNIDDGVQVGEGVDVDWDLDSLLATGSGTYAFTLQTLTTVLMQGQLSLESTEGCLFLITATNLVFNVLAPDGGPTGTIEFTTNGMGESLTGTIQFDGTSTASLTAFWKGAPVTFTIDLDTFVVS